MAVQVADAPGANEAIGYATEDPPTVQLDGVPTVPVPEKPVVFVSAIDTFDNVGPPVFVATKVYVIVEPAVVTLVGPDFVKDRAGGLMIVNGTEAVLLARLVSATPPSC